MTEVMVSHKIRIDKYMSVDLDIPKEMDSYEFKGLMIKVDKLFKIGNMEDATIEKTIEKKKREPYTQIKWSQDMDIFVVKNYKSLGKEKCAEEMSKLFQQEVTPSKVRLRYYLRYKKH